METKKVTAERDKTKNVIAEIIIRALCRNAWGFNFALAFVFLDILFATSTWYIMRGKP